MVRNILLLALSGFVMVGCGAPQTVKSLGSNQATTSNAATDEKLVAEAYGLISRWLLDRNYMVATVMQFKQGRPAAKVAVRGTFWSTYRTKRGFIFNDGYWNLTLRDESDPTSIGTGRTGRGRYDKAYGPTYSYFEGSATGQFGNYAGYDDTMYDDYDEDYTDDCDGATTPGYGSGSGYGSGHGQQPYGRKRRSPGRFDDGLDCYPGNTGGTPGYGGGPGSPYRSPYNSYQGQNIPLLRVKDNSKSRNFKIFNGEGVMAFLDGDKVKEVRLMRDGAAVYKSMF